MSPTTAFIVHQMPGRTRLRVPSRRGDPAFFLRAEEELHGLPGIRQVRSNWRTTGILMLHEGDLAPIAEAMRERGLLEIRPQRTEEQEATRTRLVRGVADPLPALAIGFAGLGAYQAARGRVFGNAVESLWYAYGMRRAQEAPWAAAGLAAIGAYQMARGGRILGSGTSLLIYALAARRMARRARIGAGEPA